MSRLVPYIFSSGVTIDINKDKIIATATNYSNTISFGNLDNFRYNETSKSRITTIGLMARTLALSFFLMIFNKVLSFKNPHLSDILFYSGLLLMLLTFVSFLAFTLDVFLEFRFFDTIISNFFTDKGYLVIIGNKSGNNMEFYANTDDLKLIQELESEVYDIKNKYDEGFKIDNKIGNGYLDELKKLGDLLRDGILTQVEFDIKKKELLSNK